MDILTIDVGGTYIKYGLIDNQLNIASVDKGIHNKTTKYGLPTY